MSDEARLLRNLFDDYDNQVRPVFNTTDVVNVRFSLSLIQIVNVVSVLLWRQILEPACVVMKGRAHAKEMVHFDLDALRL